MPFNASWFQRILSSVCVERKLMIIEMWQIQCGACVRWIFLLLHYDVRCDNILSTESILSKHWLKLNEKLLLSIRIWRDVHTCDPLCSARARAIIGHKSAQNKVDRFDQPPIHYYEPHTTIWFLFFLNTLRCASGIRSDLFRGCSGYFPFENDCCPWWCFMYSNERSIWANKEVMSWHVVSTSTIGIAPRDDR